jgi:hypothetical protein
MGTWVEVGKVAGTRVYRGYHDSSSVLLSETALYRAWGFHKVTVPHPGAASTRSLCRCSEQKCLLSAVEAASPQSGFQVAGFFDRP